MKQLLAVFGHYDSRGGTTGMPIEAATVEAVKAACRKYDEDCFNWSDVGQGLDDTHRPSQSDFLFVAELHHEDDADLVTRRDLVWDNADVLIDETTEPTWPDVAGKPEAEFVAAIEASLAKPTQLELLILPKPINQDLDESVQNGIKEYLSKFLEHPAVHRWDDDAFGFMLGTGL